MKISFCKFASQPFKKENIEDDPRRKNLFESCEHEDKVKYTCLNLGRMEDEEKYI